jgi:hypothetical protein
MDFQMINFLLVLVPRMPSPAHDRFMAQKCERFWTAFCKEESSHLCRFDLAVRTALAAVRQWPIASCFAIHCPHSLCRLLKPRSLRGMLQKCAQYPKTHQ